MQGSDSAAKSAQAQTEARQLFRSAGTFRPGVDPRQAATALAALTLLSQVGKAQAGFSVQVGGGLGGALGFIALIVIALLIYRCMKNRGHSDLGAGAAAVGGTALTKGLLG